MSEWSDMIALAAANKRYKYQGARPIASLSPTERRRLTGAHVSRGSEKAVTTKKNSALKKAFNDVFGSPTRK